MQEILNENIQLQEGGIFKDNLTMGGLLELIAVGIEKEVIDSPEDLINFNPAKVLKELGFKTLQEFVEDVGLMQASKRRVEIMDE